MKFPDDTIKTLVTRLFSNKNTENVSENGFDRQTAIILFSQIIFE
ncbi:hypothetical protein HNQ93_001412 [Hymenobacter luteus]|uniref:Uncharacterized protein n=2 Tax=Hymenobacter TaxID=89966 RepID=A0A7W9WBP8_9BACT|nr:hypothetical protein [Hymenobacter latericoloratus]MBB6058566.1 hypothetical protein [Hymenobacter luteus]